MKTMHPVRVAFALCLAALFYGSNSSAQTVVYQQTSTSGLNFSTATQPLALDDITFAPGSTLVAQRLSALTFGVVVLPNTTAQTARVFIDFYNTVNPASAGAVQSELIGGFSGNLTITANAALTPAARTFTFNGLNGLVPPILFTDDNVGIVITLANAAGTAYSTILTPLMSAPGTPTVGASVSGVYRDTNADNTFQSTEFAPTQGNLYLQITTVAVPEPGTVAMFGVGLLPLVAALRRRQKK